MRFLYRRVALLDTEADAFSSKSATSKTSTLIFLPVM
jgi:hypothetical protein